MTVKISDMLPDDVGHGDVLYIVDRQLRVIHTNEAWAKFAANNNGARLVGKGWNANLLENMSDKEKTRWGHIYRLLLEARIPHHNESFICSSPVEKRNYQLRITPQKDNDGNIAWLVHHTFTIDETRKALDYIGGRLKKDGSQWRHPGVPTADCQTPHQDSKISNGATFQTPRKHRRRSSLA